MKTLKQKHDTLGEVFEAELIVKTSDSITGYNGDTEVFSMRGISDFSGYELLDGAEWDTPIQSPTIEDLQAENTSLKLALAEMAETQQTDKQEMQLALAEIADLIGGINHG